VIANASTERVHRARLGVIPLRAQMTIFNRGNPKNLISELENLSFPTVLVVTFIPGGYVFWEN
jgi:hypothetical protein